MFINDRPETPPVSRAQTQAQIQGCFNHRSELMDRLVFQEEQGDVAGISPSELVLILENPGLVGCETIVVIDARFDYEFNGGHIRGALHVPTKATMVEAFEFLLTQVNPATCLLVFHCEFSSSRGPAMAREWRSYDRKRIVSAGGGYRADEVTFPFRAILEGGYSRCFAELSESVRNLFEGGYVPMHAEKHKSELRGRLGNRRGFGGVIEWC
jgi:rhodanese-related sulfurtransferase